MINLDGPMDEIDPGTRRMMDETGHSCIMCPVAVRSLKALAHNAVHAVQAAQRGGGDWTRAFRKIAELHEFVELLGPVSDEHFRVLDAWRRP